MIITDNVQPGFFDFPQVVALGSYLFSRNGCSIQKFSKQFQTVFETEDDNIVDKYSSTCTGYLAVVVSAKG